MGSKTISLKEEIYHRLAREKGADESFSDVVDRLLASEDQPLFQLAGLLDEEQATELRERSQSFRADADDRMLGPADR